MTTLSQLPANTEFETYHSQLRGRVVGCSKTPGYIVVENGERAWLAAGDTEVAPVSTLPERDQ